MVERLAWVTAGPARGTDPDEPPAVASLRAAGAVVDVVDWDDPHADWSGYDRVVLRSPWDYQERLIEFLAWLTDVERVTDLRNPLAPIGWSIDKRYLADLAAEGVPITPTRFVEPGAKPTFDGPSWIVKPAVGAGSRDVVMFRAGDEQAAEAHVARLHARGVTALVQPVLDSVAVDGEWPMVFFDGRFSHSANKRVRLGGTEGLDELFARETNVPHVATDEQIRVAEQAMAVVERRFGELTYARIDLVRDDAGNYCVLEVELVEPSLMLPEGGDGAVERLTRALLS